MISPSPSSCTGCRLTVRAHINVGFGNELYIRGEGHPGLSWLKGVKMTARTSDLWEYNLDGARSWYVMMMLIQ